MKGIKSKISYDKTKGEVYKLPCRRCDGETNHVVLASVEDRWNYDDAVDGCSKYEIVGCRGCNEISFRLASSNSEDMANDEETGEIIYPEDVEVYPSRLSGRKQLVSTYMLPPEVQKIYEETHASLCSHLNILAGVGIRILVEAVCKEKNAKGKNLENKINDLIKSGILTRQEANTLHSVRWIGNKSAHEIIAPKDNELDIAMDIVENLLKTVYIIPKKAEKLKTNGKR